MGEVTGLSASMLNTGCLQVANLDMLVYQVAQKMERALGMVALGLGRILQYLHHVVDSE